jgi:hypothetical protein
MPSINANDAERKTRCRLQNAQNSSSSLGLLLIHYIATVLNSSTITSCDSTSAPAVVDGSEVMVVVVAVGSEFITSGFVGAGKDGADETIPFDDAAGTDLFVGSRFSLSGLADAPNRAIGKSPLARGVSTEMSLSFLLAGGPPFRVSESVLTLSGFGADPSSATRARGLDTWARMGLFAIGALPFVRCGDRPRSGGASPPGLAYGDMVFSK